MGMHKDGSTWNLERKELNNRRYVKPLTLLTIRRIFWESFASEVYMSKSCGRP